MHQLPNINAKISIRNPFMLKVIWGENDKQLVDTSKQCVSTFIMNILQLGRNNMLLLAVMAGGLALQYMPQYSSSKGFHKC